MKRTLLLALLLCATLHAQPPAPPNPQAPLLNPLPLSGAQRGTTIELNLGGKNLAGPTGVWTSFPAKVTIPTDKNNGQSPTQLLVKLEIPKDAPLGFHFIRLATSKGMSNTRLFCIDDLPEVAEVATNRDVKTAQAVPVPCVVSGRADAEATDHFKVSVKAGQRLSFEVLGRRLGSAFDPQITLLDASGKELPGGFSNDAPGLQNDPRLTMTFKEAGDVIVAVRDASYAGGADFFYRLRIGDFPCATAPVPSGIKRGSKAKIGFAGPQVEGVAAVEVQAPGDPWTEAMQVTPVGPSGLPGWPVALAVSDLPELVETEPNDDAGKANRITMPSAITGRFEKKNDIDHYVLSAKKGQRVAVEVQTAEWGSPSDVYVVVKDSKGGQVAASNPATVPARLEFTATGDGDYVIAVEHLHSWGGPDETYRLLVTPGGGRFALTLAIDRFQVPAAGDVSVPVFIQRAGYNGPVEVSVEGAKGLSGKATIPAGAPKPNVPAVVLQLKAEDLPVGPTEFRVVGKATVDGQPVTELASARNVLSAGLANLPIPPQDQGARIGLAILEKPPFTLTAKAPAAVAPGAGAKVTVSVVRTPDFKGEVVLGLAGKVPGVTMGATKIAADKNEVTVELKLAGNAKLGPMALTLEGRAKHAGQDWVRQAAPVTITIKK